MITTRIPVRFADCDAMGHVNNAVYFTYFEEGKREIFRWFTPDMDTRHWHVIVASTHCDYLKEITYGGDMTVYTWIGHISTHSFDVEHAIGGDDGVWHARGRVTLIGYDFKSKRVEAISERMKRIFAQHRKAPEGVPELRPIRQYHEIR